MRVMKRDKWESRLCLSMAELILEAKQCRATCIILQTRRTFPRLVIVLGISKQSKACLFVGANT